MDSRLTGETAENIFLSIVNQLGVFATAFDTPAFDGIIFDSSNRYFKVGQSPFYVQIKCRGSTNDRYNPQGHSPNVIDAIRTFAQKLGIEEISLYFVLGFYKNNDIRQIVFFAIPFAELEAFKTSGQYRFSVVRCEQMMPKVKGMFRL